MNSENVEPALTDMVLCTEDSDFAMVMNHVYIAELVFMYIYSFHRFFFRLPFEDYN